MDVNIAGLVRKAVAGGSDRSAVDGAYYECRRCGTGLDGEGDVCPHCGCSDVARYELY